jgi:hypothetical protein
MRYQVLGATRTCSVLCCLHRASWEAWFRWRELFMFSHGTQIGGREMRCAIVCVNWVQREHEQLLHFHRTSWEAWCRWCEVFMFSHGAQVGGRDA